ncbi:hypothetical protein [Bradyrhizobium japonicum]|uniref:hypothetical protein n=1 Tax=Bradyrhizobium japonicum TaxID=375 RepID=UPI00040EC1AB|nr:hypothetical protein [Bradyrhizobium japonicum]WLB91312.1 hypothetical protein QIH91_13370 [Bradyrhizobium japonicum USDA 135]
MADVRPKVARGAFVQLVPNIVGFLPNIVLFQYNPEKLTHTLTPWNPFDTDQSQRGAQAPAVQPFNPKETFSLSIDVDASDALGDGDAGAVAVGIADKLAALKKLTLPSKGPIGDLIASAGALLGGGASGAERPTVPIVLFVWGPGRILPVRLTAFSVDETSFSPLLFPVQAKVTVTIEVLPPDVFKCNKDTTAKIAMAAYNYTKTMEDALAVKSALTDTASALAILPF